MNVDKINEKLKNIDMRERCLELTQELATVKQRAEKAEARVKELEANLADILGHRHRKDGTLQMILEEIAEEYTK